MKTFYIIFVSLLALNCSAQNISGIWRGSFGNDYFGDISAGDSYKFEVQIDQRQTEARGVTYSYHNTDFYAKASLTGKWNKTTKKFTLVEGDIIEVRKMNGVSVCSMTCYLTYSKVGDVEYLIGTYKSVNDEDKTYCGGGKVRLKKTVTSVFRKEPFLVRRDAIINAKRKTDLANNKAKPKNTTPTKTNTASIKPKTNLPITPKTQKPNTIKNNPTKTQPNNTKTPTEPTKQPEIVKTIPKNLPPPPPIVRERKNEIVETIPLDNENISVNLYDNGEIDGDVISVYLNGKLVISKQTLNYEPITINFKKSDLLDVNELVMVAENMGTIPPNTASMIVYVGSKRYEVRMESNVSKNAAVRFQK